MGTSFQELLFAGLVHADEMRIPRERLQKPLEKPAVTQIQPEVLDLILPFAGTPLDSRNVEGREKWKLKISRVRGAKYQLEKMNARDISRQSVKRLPGIVTRFSRIPERPIIEPEQHIGIPYQKLSEPGPESITKIRRFIIEPPQQLEKQPRRHRVSPCRILESRSRP